LFTSRISLRSLPVSISSFPGSSRVTISYWLKFQSLFRNSGHRPSPRDLSIFRCLYFTPASNSKMTGQLESIAKTMVVVLPRYYHRICMWNITKHLRKDIWYPGRDLNRESSGIKPILLGYEELYLLGYNAM
jgi:hypothetical protein